MEQDRQQDRGGSGGTGRRSFLKGATTTLLAAGALGTSVTNAAAASEQVETVTKRIETWDGKELATQLYLPDTKGPAPAVLMTHGYGSDKEDAALVRTGTKYAEAGFVVLTYDSRGFGESDGEVGVDGPKEVKDAQSLLDWLGYARQADVGRESSGLLVQGDERNGGRTGTRDVDNPGSGPDIKVGMDGLSYAGGIQLNLAAVDDRLDAIVPRWAWNDLTYSLAPNGGIKAGWTTILQEFGAQGSRDIETGGDSDNDIDERDVRNGVDPRLYKFYTESVATNEFSPAARSFFKLRSPSTKAAGLAENAPPSLLITGWNDTLFTATEAVRNHELLEGGGQDSRMVFIRGGHSLEQQAPLEQGEIDAMALDWMTEHVAGGKRADLAEVTYWQQEAEAFAEADALPSAAEGPSRTLTEATNASSGTTDLAGGPAGGSNSEILVQRNDDYAPGTFADFDFPVEEHMELLGVPEITLNVTPLGRDPLVFAKVYHVDSAGNAELLYNQSTPYRVEGPVGESQDISFELAGVQRQFEAGDTLRVTLSTTDVAYFNSRTSAGVSIDNDGSEVRIPVKGTDGLAAASSSSSGASNPVTGLESFSGTL
ncbi:CocE/NonD family hydrolase [Haloglomus halophilum]|uniref:CocE/NonD family hydrolase n=1 Tax=Haloglomus halophilum TaxID=2962672 RepID=UPI0020CA14DA|nr:CocE/NonD family hydrolase [Haloglomus halophilum]